VGGVERRKVEWEGREENEEVGEREEKWERETKRKATEEGEWSRERRRKGSNISFSLYIELQQDGITAIDLNLPQRESHMYLIA